MRESARLVPLQPTGHMAAPLTLIAAPLALMFAALARLFFVLGRHGRAELIVTFPAQPPTLS